MNNYQKHQDRMHVLKCRVQESNDPKVYEPLCRELLGNLCPAEVLTIVRHESVWPTVGQKIQSVYKWKIDRQWAKYGKRRLA